MRRLQAGQTALQTISLELIKRRLHSSFKKYSNLMISKSSWDRKNVAAGIKTMCSKSMPLICLKIICRLTIQPELLWTLQLIQNQVQDYLFSSVLKLEISIKSNQTTNKILDFKIVSKKHHFCGSSCAPVGRYVNYSKIWNFKFHNIHFNTSARCYHAVTCISITRNLQHSGHKLAHNLAR